MVIPSPYVLPVFHADVPSSLVTMLAFSLIKHGLLFSLKISCYTKYPFSVMFYFPYTLLNIPSPLNHYITLRFFFFKSHPPPLALSYFQDSHPPVHVHVTLFVDLSLKGISTSNKFSLQ